MKLLIPTLLALGAGAWAGSLPQEPRFDAKVDLKVSESQVRAGLTLPLDVVLEALARSVGLQPLIYRAYDASGDPAKAQPPLPNIKLDFQGKPFREVWDLLFATYGTQFNLDYLFLPPDVVVVAPTQVITALVDAPSRTGAMERKPYLVAIPEIAYRRTETDAQGQARTVVNIDGAKAWVQNDLLPFLSREASGLSVNWIVVEEGGKLRALLSVLATPEQHTRFSDILQRAGIDFRPLPALTLPKPRVERTYVLTHSTFPEILSFLQTQVPNAQVAVVPTDPKRALIIATEEDHARIAELLKVADVPKPTPVVRRVYALQNLTFQEAQERLKPVLERELKGARLEGVPGNPKALLLEATEADQAFFAEILKAADVPPQVAPPTQEATVRRLYPLRFADAEKVAPFLAREVPGIVVQTVPGQPVLSVRGTEKQLSEVETLLAQIDRAPEQGPPVFQRSYQLSNAKAAELAKVLQEALQAQKAQGQGQTQPQTPGRQATVVADERTNTLIVTGTQEDLALVEGLIPKLDQAVPQVNLRVRIQEVQSNFSRNLGLKWNTIAGGNVAASILDSGLSLIFDSTRSLAALNIIATLEALQRQGLSRALRDVNQTVLNNQTARLQSGETFLIRRVVDDRVERVPFDIGIIVEVTPQITADGQILLNIKAEVSGNVQRNPVDGDVDRFTKQVVTTTLRVRDGQTVVLGGLTSQENTQVQQGVPLLMDIPLIGELFKQRSQETTDRELLVVITADILKETASR
ncbi:competence protein [Thermus scotoductus]|uniref:Competence protein n=1 Tax=Thermus scotoductus TaxID=37636 RepID=A0A430SCQ7_THESC|nr:secretin N-terminal domain-containing protein [Thermus scotoductus]RTG98242.1 competence protein [Thermus scotoductus]RTH11505.1 competence protein [Thermus scotoductus]RTH12972.1 competence protein [Thermus scotoductus]RTH14425.1 competence protein [Thermus scotoductus]RTH14507.1 competence protein [Thermus scotoductus]